ncbi:MAG: hypothetical protein KKF26_00295 [Chloroflexi bacterium]|nr:hypothetical protein [Chloroflexota bacterium]
MKEHNTDIYSDFQDEIREITKPNNKISRWFGDYYLILAGLYFLIRAAFDIENALSDYSQSLSASPAIPDLAKRMDVIFLLNAQLNIEMTAVWYSLLLGIGFLGWGLIEYIRRSNNRMAQVTTASLSATGRMISRAINDKHIE